MALTRITKGVIKPNENYDTHNINSTGIVTAIGLDVNGNGDISGNLSVGGVLTYEDVTSIDSVGIITARDGIHVGAGLSVVGIGSFGTVKVGSGVTIEGNGQATFVGVTTFGNLVGGASTSIVVNRDLVLRDIWGYGNHIKFIWGTNTLNFPSASTANIAQLPNLSFGDRTNNGNQVGIGDFLMYHDYYNMHMKYRGASGNVVLSNNNTEIHISGSNGSGGTQQSIRIKSGSTEGVLLHHGGNAKFETAGIGASVYGTLVATGADINGDLDVDGHTNLDNVSVAGVSTFSGNVTVDAGANTTVDVIADSAGVAMVRTGGASGDQTTAAFELRQSSTSQQGGGISYNGDGSPSFVSGETADNVTFYRILNGTRSEVFSYPYNSDIVTFNSTVIAPLFQGNLTGTINTAAQTNITSIGTLGSLTVNGGSSPISFSHIGGNCVTFNRNGKTIALNANYAGQNNYAHIAITSGMDIRLQLGGADRIVLKSAGHIEPQTDSQINLGSNTVRFANVYADTLYGDGSNLTGLSSDLVNDTSPQLGGHLDVNDFQIKNGNQIYEIVDNARHKFSSGGNQIIDINGNGVDFLYGNNTHADGVESRFGTGNDLKIFHNGSNSGIINSQGALYVQNTATNSSDLHLQAKTAIKMHCPSDGTERLTIFNNGAVKIGDGVGSGGGGLAIYGGTVNQSSGQDACLYVRHDSNADWGMWLYKQHEYGFRIDSNNTATLSLAIYDQTSTIKHQFKGNGDYIASGFVDSASDIKLKTNIKTIDNALDKVLQLRGAEYDRIDKDNQHEIGVIAQEVEKIIPEVVHGDETKTVSYGNMVAVLIEAIKEQNKVINKMKKEINDLKDNV